jgi:hypothetical protein
MEKMFPTEKPIPAKPRLRGMNETLALLGSETGPDGQRINWKDLHEQIGTWNSGLELSDKIRAVVREYVLSKFPTIKAKIPSIEDLSAPQMLNALSNGWFEELGEEVGDTRREVLLAVLAHLTRKIETRIYRKTLEKASENDLQKLGLSSNLRQLTMDCLDAAVKSDPLFIRFLAYSQLAPKPPEDASPVAPLGQDGKPHTLRELFPQETGFISRRLTNIAKQDGAWKNEPEAEKFKEYLKYLADFFAETDPEEARTLHKKAEEAYSQLVFSDFPIIIVPPSEGYYKPPYLDPELRVVLRTPESKAQENNFRSVQGALADNLAALGAGQFSENLRDKKVRSYIAIGSYGVGITFNAVAQEEPVIALYLDEQIRAYDTNLKNFLPLVDAPKNTFAATPAQKIEEISRTDTIMHELSHSVYPTETPEAKRLGAGPESVIAEITAESIYRGLAKKMIDAKKMGCTEDQYVSATICMPLQVIENSDPDDEYFKAAVFVLNGLFEKGIAKFPGSKIYVKDHALFFKYLEDNAKAVIALYEDPKMTESKAKKWLAKNCQAGSKLQKLIDHLKAHPRATG